jgi:hypothetical protein
VTAKQHHVWEKVEITLTAQSDYANPYTAVDVWLDLRGPGFEGRVYGFWDGDRTYRVRVVATAPGEWSWVSGASQPDAGLNGQSGSLTAVAWSQAELDANACRRGFLRATANGHGLEYADGTPCFLIGDTWWAVPTHRFRWHEDDEERPIGSEMGLKDLVRFRKAQGYNCIAMIAAFPNWANDGHPARIPLGDGTFLRAAWRQAGTASAKDMHNEGGRPFHFPGRVPGFEDVYPDVDRLNPAYFQAMDRKIDYLNAQGFIPFIEAARRDGINAWQAHYDWPDSYTRYLQYLFARYQANNVILSPIHFDSGHATISSRDYNAPANSVVQKGIPAFGTLLSCNAAGSSLSNFGNSDEAPWLTLHQIGNRRHHNSHWFLTEIYHESAPPKPALNGEPVYDVLSAPYDVGWPPGLIPGTAESACYCRSGHYGSFLSGGLAGEIYGAAGLWGGDIEPEAPYRLWDSLTWPSGGEMTHFRDFVWSEGRRFQELVPNAELVEPNRTHQLQGNVGWAYCARTRERDLFMVYFEAECPAVRLRGAAYQGCYRAWWFDPRTGVWGEPLELHASAECEIELPAKPNDDDWALKLRLIGC